MHRYLAIVLAVSISSTALGEEIPLKSIWALDMPGTRDVKELEPDAFGPDAQRLPDKEQIEVRNKSFTGQICTGLKRDTRPKPGFVVAGIGLDALKSAAGVLAGDQKAGSSLPSDSEVTAVFSSLQSGSYVHVYEAERNANVVEVRYRFVPHDDTNVTEHFALIPLGKLPSGNYQVKMVQDPAEPKAAAYAERRVCGSFKFSVK